MPSKRGGFGTKSFGSKRPVHAVMTRALWPSNSKSRGFDTMVREHMIKTHEGHLRTPPPGTGRRRPK
jgi:hypothetical protein